MLSGSGRIMGKDRDANVITVYEYGTVKKILKCRKMLNLQRHIQHTCVCMMDS